MAYKNQVVEAEVISGFSERFLISKYDGALDIPKIHMEWWKMCGGPQRFVSIAAPRGHAKTTAITLAYTLCLAVFRKKKYIVIIGNNEGTAIEHLAHIRNEISDNVELKRIFGIQGFKKEGATDIIVEFLDGFQFRVIAKGVGQKIRGLQWQGTRPDLVIMDDVEDDEAVESRERRDKLKRWVLAVVIPCLSRQRGQIRLIGTILHGDSLLMNTIRSPSWTSRLYKAHESFDDFSNILWPEMWDEDGLRAIRQTFIDTGNPEGYSQEYLNDPSDIRNNFFRVEDMIPMEQEDHSSEKVYYIGADFALSDKNYSDYSAFVVGGYDSEGTLNIVDVQRVRTEDTNEIVEILFALLDHYKPEYFIWEKGILANVIGPPFLSEMQRRNKFAHVEAFPALNDKRLRAVPIQQRMRAGGVKYDAEADWVDSFFEELMKFPKATHDDQVDAFAWLGRGIAEFIEAPTEEELEQDEWEMGFEATFDYDYTGTGY